MIEKHEVAALSRAMGKAVRGFVLEEVAKLSAAVDGIRGSLDKSVHGLESAERRLSRHAEHLAALETRLKSLERK